MFLGKNHFGAIWIVFYIFISLNDEHSLNITFYNYKKKIYKESNVHNFINKLVNHRPSGAVEGHGIYFSYMLYNYESYLDL